MPEVRKHPTWDDPRWKNSVGKFPPHQKLLLENSLRELLQTLKTCEDPLRDPLLQVWLPSPWAVPRKQETYGAWVEYRLGDSENRARVVICFVSIGKPVIYLVARTAIHDHESLRELVAQFRP